MNQNQRKYDCKLIKLKGGINKIKNRIVKINIKTESKIKPWWDWLREKGNIRRSETRKDPQPLLQKRKTNS